jgi:catechol 2,3-dioxygenase-like lactoylglutathione lyase family enzyme
MLSGCEVIGFVPTIDAERAREFYCGMLGLEFVEDDGFAMVVRTRGCLVRVVRVGEFKPQPFTMFGWESPAIEDEIRSLTAAGVIFERYGWFAQDALGIWSAPGGARVAWFKDPDGNVLSVSQHG